MIASALRARSFYPSVWCSSALTRVLLKAPCAYLTSASYPGVESTASTVASYRARAAGNSLPRLSYKNTRVVRPNISGVRARTTNSAANMDASGAGSIGETGDSRDKPISYVHQTDFKLFDFLGQTQYEETNNYLVVLNYKLPKSTPHLWRQGSVVERSDRILSTLCQQR